VLAWGVFASAQGAIPWLWLLMLDRFLLGVVEAAIIPAMLILLTHWFTAPERGRANTVLILGNPITVMWLSAVSGYLIEATSWRWMFLVEGLPAIAWAFAFRALVQDRPADAAWLDPADRAALDEATRAAIPAALDASRAEDHADVAELCGDGLTLDTVAPADLDAFHTALQPVYDRLRGDPATAEWLRRIQEVKTRVAAPPDAVTCADGGPAPSAATIDGTYTAHLDWPDLQPAGCPLGDGESLAPEDYRLVLADGRARLYISSATSPQSLGFDDHYTVFQDRISLGGDNPLSARYELSGDTLTFSDMQGPCGDVTVWTTVPFHRVGG
jgi:hypothetical protein